MFENYVLLNVPCHQRGDHYYTPVPSPSTHYATIWVGGVKLLFHRLVLETHVGPCPVGHSGDHNDMDPTNNALENL